ncbi:MAG: RDD family protein [Acidimicrobiales bacterium]
MTDSGGQQPGWYYAQGDPPGTQRYWDGVQWVGGPQLAQGAAPVDTAGYGAAYEPAYGRAPGGGHPPGYALRPGTPATWGRRVVAALIDGGIALVLAAVFVGVGVAIAGINEDLAVIVLLVGIYVVPLVFYLWNAVIRQGRTGQTIGKQQQNIRLVADATAQPPGAGMAFVRYIVATAISAVTCGIGGLLDILWPLWDEDRKRLTDKVMKFSVIDA